MCSGEGREERALMLAREEGNLRGGEVNPL
jgi:hypothetical protein